MTGSRTVAVLGTGAMGSQVARRLASQSWSVTAWNRSPERARTLEDAGIRAAGTPAEAVAGADTVLLWLADGAAIQETLASAGVTPLLDSRLIVQMATIAPEESRDLSATITGAGGRYLECPVLGSLPEAREGRLILMAGGPEEAFEEAYQLLSALGPQPARLGRVGQGAAAKLAFNHLIGALTSAFSLSLGLVRREGVDVESFMDLLRGSAVYAPTFDKKLEKMWARDFDSANFSTRHLLKDLRLFEDAARRSGLNTTTMPALVEVVQRAVDQGAADCDYSAIYQIFDPPAR